MGHLEAEVTDPVKLGYRTTVDDFDGVHALIREMHEDVEAIRNHLTVMVALTASVLVVGLAAALVVIWR